MTKNYLNNEKKPVLPQARSEPYKTRPKAKPTSRPKLKPSSEVLATSWPLRSLMSKVNFFYSWFLSTRCPIRGSKRPSELLDF